jgi:hypothetical protein
VTPEELSLPEYDLDGCSACGRNVGAKGKNNTHTHTHTHTHTPHTHTHVVFTFCG